MLLLLLLTMLPSGGSIGRCSWWILIELAGVLDGCSALDEIALRSLLWDYGLSLLCE